MIVLQFDAHTSTHSLLFAPVTHTCLWKNLWGLLPPPPFKRYLIPSLSDFSTLYIHYFVYTVYDDFGGCWCLPGKPGPSAATVLTHLTATETDSGRHHVHLQDRKGRLSTETTMKSRGNKLASNAMQWSKRFVSPFLLFVYFYLGHSRTDSSGSNDWQKRCRIWREGETGEYSQVRLCKPAT